ncbi:MAG: hypothetical protein Q9186_003633 [Xanthomendoza sp. 1 TL-2023]
MKPANIFAGGWSEQKAQKTRCKACHKIKAMTHFSAKQQLDLKHRIAGPHGEKAASAIAEIITCRACNGGSNYEMTCVICGEPKGLAAFSKAQRKDPDNARCLLCVNEHVTEPWAHVERNEELSDEDSDNDSTTDTYTYSVRDFLSHLPVNAHGVRSRTVTGLKLIPLLQR